MNRNAETPCNGLPILPPNLKRTEARSVLRACISVHAAIAELETADESIPDRGLLINILPTLEVEDLSRIENTVTASDRLFQYTDCADDVDPATKEVLRYRIAFYDDYTRPKDYPLYANTVVTTCTKLRAAQTDVRRTPGTILRDQNNNVVYVLPVGEDSTRELLASWERFIHGDNDLDLLVKVAITHYRLECTHPFPDGNGRTGRILSILHLIQSELFSLSILYLSRSILERRDDYYTLLYRVTEEGDWKS